MGPFQVCKAVKITSVSNSVLSEEVLLPWLEEQPLERRKKFVFMQGNAPTHSAKATKQFHAQMGFQGDGLATLFARFKPNRDPLGDQQT